MGWNLFAAFANLGFGFISNIIEGSDGRNYSYNNFWKAQMMVLNSLPGVNKLTPNGNKVRELMYYFDVLKQSKNELYESSSTRLFKRIGDKLDWINPYAPQSRTEYMNQAPVMIAMMMDQKVKRTVDGKEEEISMWDAFTTDGTLIDGVTISDRELTDFKIRVDKLVKMNHGNYDPDSAIRFKRIWFGRAVSQFRTWAYQGFAERFKGEFIISKSIKQELIDVPINSRKFELEAVILAASLAKNDLTFYNNSANLDKKTSYLLDLANNIFSVNGNPIKIVDRAEIEGLALTCILKSSAYVVDERTMRLFMEDSEGLKTILEGKLHTSVSVDNKMLSDFKKQINGVNIIRSSELMMVALEKGLFEEYINVKNKRELVDAILWGLRLRGCAISTEEINETIKLVK